MSMLRHNLFCRFMKCLLVVGIGLAIETVSAQTPNSSYGIYQLPKCVVEGLRANKLGIVKYLVTDVL
jgi:hypothetical protein